MSAPERLVARGRALQDAGLTDDTRKRYASCWQEFVRWCAQAHHCPLPAAQLTIIAYLTVISERVGETAIDQRAAAIRRVHLLAGYPNPCRSAAVRQLRYGMRVLKPRSLQRKAAMAITTLRVLIDSIAMDDRGKRDRCFLLVGFAGGFGAQRLASLRVERIKLVQDELHVFEDAHRTVLQAAHDPLLDPISAYRVWISAAHLSVGPLFRPINKGGAVRPAALKPDSFSWILKGRCTKAGLGERDYGVRSLRDGLIAETTAPANRLLDHLHLSNLGALRKKVRQLQWPRARAEQR